MNTSTDIRRPRHRTATGTTGAGAAAWTRAAEPPPRASQSSPTTSSEERLCALAGTLAATEAEFLLLVAELDDRGLWGRPGLRSAAHWLSWRLGMRLGAARERVRVGHALRQLPAIATAFGDGQLSYCKVRALTRVATPTTESELLEIGLGTTGAQCETGGPCLAHRA